MQLAAPSTDLLTASHQGPCDGRHLTQSSAPSAMGDDPTPFEQELDLAGVGDDAGSMPARTGTVAEAPTQGNAVDTSDDLAGDEVNIVPLTVGEQAVLPSLLDELAANVVSSESAETKTPSAAVLLLESQPEAGAEALLDPSVGSSDPSAGEPASVQKPASALASPEAEVLTVNVAALAEAGAPAADSETVEQSGGAARSITMAASVADKLVPQSDENGQAQAAPAVREVVPPVSTGLEGTDVSDHGSDGQPATHDERALSPPAVASETSIDFGEALSVGEDGDQVLHIVQGTTSAAIEVRPDELHVDVVHVEEAHADSPALPASTELGVPAPVNGPSETSAPVQELVAPARNDQAAVEAFRTAMVERIAQAAQNYLRDGQSQMRIRLSPPELGEIHLRFSMDGERASAEVAVTKPEAVQLIMQHIEQLRRSLAEVGVELGSFDVSERETSHGGRQQNGQSESGREWQDLLNDLDFGMDSEEAELDKPEEVSPGLVASWQASVTAGHRSFDAVA